MKRLLCALMAGAAILGTAACSAEHGADASTTDASTAAQTAETDGTSAAEGYFADFTAETIDGTEVSQNVFADHDRTLVNVMATWCGPCIAEIPELEELYESGDAGVVAIVLDTAQNGALDEDALTDAQLIQDRLSVTYPMLVPDASGFNGLDRTIQAFPTSYVVDSVGTVVAGPYEGSRDLAAWKSIVEASL